jgi:two-component system, sensor histidine kinase and response regulator
MAPSSPTHSAPPLDPAVLDQYRRQMPGRPDIIVRIIESFLRASPNLLAALQAAVRSRDPEAIRQAGHAMKSSNGQVGAHRLAAMAHELEIYGAQGKIDAATSRLADLEREYRAVEEELKHLLLAETGKGG